MQQQACGFDLRGNDAPKDVETVVVLGGGGHASDVVSIMESLGIEQAFSVIVADDSKPKNRFEDRHASVADSIDRELESGRRFVSGVGYPEPRRLLVGKAIHAGLIPLDGLIHPTAVLATGATVHVGAVVAGLSFISAQAQIEQHAYVGYGAKVGHNTLIGAYSSLMPGSFVAGDARVGEGVLVGANATVLQGLTVGTGATIGAGAVVTTDVAPGSTVVGIPAKTLGNS